MTTLNYPTPTCPNSGFTAGIKIIAGALKKAAMYHSQANPTELLALFKATLTTPGKIVVEVGSATGGTTVLLIKASNLVGKSVISIDPYPESIEGAVGYPTGTVSFFRQGFKENILDNGYKNITQINETTEDCIGQIPDNLSVVFIDGFHEYESVKREYELLFPKVTDDGLMFIHDVNWKIGQKSNSLQGGVANIKELFPNADYIGNNMLCIKKQTK